MEAGDGQDRHQDDNTSGASPGGGAPGPPEGPPRQSRRRGVLIGGGIALGLVFLMVGTIALVLIAGPGGSGDGGGGRAAPPIRFEERYVSGEGSDKVAVLPIVGVIGSDASTPPLGTPAATPEDLRNQLRQAGEDDGVKAIIVEVDSPGGGVVASDQMHESIQDFKEETGKPVVVSMSETAASGGYYVATAGDEIVANPATLTGSLGVIVSILNYQEAAETLGLEQEVYKSDEFKDILSGSRERTPEEEEILQELISQDYDQFVEVIVEGREMPEETVRELADGRIYSGRQAESLGLVDDLGDLERAADVSEELAGVDETTVVRYERQPGLAELLRARLAPSKPEALQILEAAGFSPTPELQYLYRP